MKKSHENQFDNFIEIKKKKWNRVLIIPYLQDVKKTAIIILNRPFACKHWNWVCCFKFWTFNQKLLNLDLLNQIKMEIEIWFFLCVGSWLKFLPYQIMYADVTHLHCSNMNQNVSSMIYKKRSKMWKTLETKNPSYVPNKKEFWLRTRNQAPRAWF